MKRTCFFHPCSVIRSALLSLMIILVACTTSEIEPAQQESQILSPLISGAHYTIHSRHSNKCLGQDGSPSARRCEAGWWIQNWELITIDASANLFMLKNRVSGQCLMSNAVVNDGALHFSNCDTSWWAGHWYFDALDAVHFKIRNRHSSYCLESNASISDGALGKAVCNTQYWTQHWQLLPAQSANYSWSPYHANDCYVFADTEQNCWYRLPSSPSPNCDMSAQPPIQACSERGRRPLAWVLGGYNESLDTYTPGPHISDAQIGPGRLWNFTLYPNAGWGMALDKSSWPDFRDQYTWVGVSDNFDLNWIPRPNLGMELYADFRLGLFGQSREFDQTLASRFGTLNGWGKGRVHLGVLARWGTPPDLKNHFMEVVFWDHPEYDGCTPTSNWWSHDGQPNPCEAPGQNLYERRSVWGDGEAVYFYASGIPQLGVPGLQYVIPTLTPGGGLVSYRIPITQLFKAYDWAGSVPDWSQAEIAGLYIGIEIWGKAWVWAEVRDYRLYAVGR